MAQWLDNERYGNGSDGVLSAGSNNTHSTVNVVCTGTSGTNSLSATGSFSAGQIIMIHQTYGTGAGQWELNVVSSYISGTVTTKYVLSYTYVTGAQVIVVKQYSQIIGVSGNYFGTAWNGSVGGILPVFCNGDLVGPDGLFNVKGKGFSGGAGTATRNVTGLQGFGQLSNSNSNSVNANGSGGGGGSAGTGPSHGGSMGGGGGSSTTGTTGDIDVSNVGPGGTGGNATGNDNLTIMTFGGGGGAGGTNDGAGGTAGGGGNGGGIILVYAKNISNNWYGFEAYGDNGSDSTSSVDGAGGGGGGGSIIIKCQSALSNVFGMETLAGSGGTSGTKHGGGGSNGRIAIYWSQSFSIVTVGSFNDYQTPQLGDIPQGYIF